MKIKKHKKLFIVIAIGIVAIIIIVSYLFFTANKIENEFVKLQTERGYSRDEYTIAAINHSFFNKFILGSTYFEWWLDVTYEDEPGIEYSYSWKQNSFVNIGTGGTNRFDSELPILKHRLPPYDEPKEK